LREYYSDEGRLDDLVITMVKGGYSASIETRKAADQPSQVAISEVDSESHRLYLMGRHHWNKRNPMGIQRAMECFRNALRLNPRDALAHAAMADCLAARAWFEMGAPAELWKEARQETIQALEITPTLSQALTTRAFEAAAFEWNWDNSEREFRRAISADPQYATAHHWYGFYCLAPQRRLSEATEELVAACALDPLSPVIRTHLGRVLYFERKYPEAIEHYRQAIEMDPGFCLAYWHLGLVFTQVSRFDEAFGVLRQAHNLGYGEWQTLWATGYVHAKCGNRGEALKVIEQLRNPGTDDYVSPVGLALLHVGLKDVDQAFECLQAALKERTSRLIHLKVEPAFDPLKTDFRFGELMKAMNLL
jgi:tetratricopeptide (TPR) repeat protein